MMRWRHGLSLGALIFPMIVVCTNQAMASSCEDLKNLSLPDTAITLATIVPDGSFALPTGAAPFHFAPNKLPAFCRVSGTIKPTLDSNINFEVWMPSGAWNGEYMSAAEGGEAGEIFYAGLIGALTRGFATASTDTGHVRNVSNVATREDYFKKNSVWDWAVGHPERVKDFAFRAKHLQTVVAKMLIKEFYGSAPEYSYLEGCSRGGHQALMEAQRYPQDYDGVIAGAPNLDYYHSMVWAVWNEQALTATSGSWIPSSKLPAIQSAALAACKVETATSGGVVENPEACHFNPACLLCRATDNDHCLTAAQVIALKKIIDGARNSKGELLVPGAFPQYAAVSDNWSGYVTGASPGSSYIFRAAQGFFGNYVFNDSNWDFRTFNFDRDVEALDKTLGAEINAEDPNLAPFEAHGGKLIIYQGWADVVVLPRVTVNYYRAVTQRMGGERATEKFARLFMVPGMMHCGGGAPDSFGQLVGFNGPVPTPNGSASKDGGHDIIAALEQWVEHGVAPQKLVASEFLMEGAKRRVAKTQLLCPYPQIAQYKGTGDPERAENFECAHSVVPVR